MNILQRYGAGGVAAAGVTFGLGVIMAAMIAVEFSPVAKMKSSKFDINPVVDDIPPPPSVERPDDFKKVETPPAPPEITKQAAILPTESVVVMNGAEMDFRPPVLDRQIFDIKVDDRDAEPLVRIGPAMPPRAEKSGHCKVRFDVSPEGAPYNVITPYCTSTVFKSASIKSVQGWKYRPKIQNGRPVARSGVESEIVFELLDERGRPIPE